MSARIAPPLPECPGCDRPVQRATFEANGGLCTDCRVGVIVARPRRRRR